MKEISPEMVNLEPHQESSPQTSHRSSDVSFRDVWHALEATDVIRTLETSPGRGLTSDEAASRLEQHGHNELREAPRPTLLRKVYEQFNNFLIVILIAASVIAAFLGDYVEAVAIMAIVVLNAVLGIIQERKAEEALAALQQLTAPEAHVVRDGHRITVPARDLVPGDIVFLDVGNYIPADLRLIETHNLRIEEAALTGESAPVIKDALVVLTQDEALGDLRNTAFSGTIVSYGRGKGVVVSTGMRTQIGMIAEMLQAVQDEPTPLQMKLDQLGRTLGWAVLAVCGLVFVIGWMQDLPPVEIFLVAVSLAVAAVPEGLPAVVTITLALGMNKMIDRHALIRRLSSVETLGSTTVICSGKHRSRWQKLDTRVHE